MPVACFSSRDRLLNRRFHAARRQFEDAGAAMLAAQRFEEIDRLLVSTAVRAVLSSGAAFREENGAFRRRGQRDDDSSANALCFLDGANRVAHVDGVKPLLVNGSPIAGGRLPAICAPLVGHTPEAIEAELAVIMQKSPDVLEWRVDHFAEITNADVVVDVARRIQAAARGTPLIFTRRSEREGGVPTSLTDEHAAALYEALCAARCVQFVDWELSGGSASIARVRAAAHGNGIALIASFHDFRATPPTSVLLDKFAQAAREGADVAKIAVMPNDPGDVLTLLDATWQASRSLDIALISMSMGPLGVVSRIAGFLYGSALTFGVGVDSSAPGQIAIDELRASLETMRRASGSVAAGRSKS
jgi:3-dehydroquinate dehydratase I